MILAPRAITRSDDHVYYYAGRAFPSVTTILKTIDKGYALVNWAAKSTAKAALRMMEGEPSQWALASLLASVGPEGVVKALTESSSWERDEAAHAGTQIHGLADRIVRGEPDMIIPEAYRQHVHHYAEWWAASQWRLRASEAMVIQPDHGYGGTLDLLAYDADGRTVLADIKTGKGVYSEAVLQLTAYGDAQYLQTQEGDLFAMPAIDRYVILHVTRDGVREIEVSVGTLERMAWAGCMDLYAWHRTTKGKRL